MRRPWRAPYGALAICWVATSLHSVAGRTGLRCQNHNCNDFELQRIRSGKTRSVQFKRGFDKGLLNDKFVSLCNNFSLKSLVLEGRKAARKSPDSLYFTTPLNFTGSVFPLLLLRIRTQKSQPKSSDPSRCDFEIYSLHCVRQNLVIKTSVCTCFTCFPYFPCIFQGGKVKMHSKGLDDQLLCRLVCRI